MRAVRDGLERAGIAATINVLTDRPGSYGSCATSFRSKHAVVVDVKMKKGP